MRDSEEFILSIWNKCIFAAEFGREVLRYLYLYK